MSKSTAYVMVCVWGHLLDSIKKKGSEEEKKKENIVHAFVVRAGTEQ
jgi:hypothetical protein